MVAPRLAAAIELARPPAAKLRTCVCPREDAAPRDARGLRPRGERGDGEVTRRRCDRDGVARAGLGAKDRASGYQRAHRVARDRRRRVVRRLWRATEYSGCRCSSAMRGAPTQCSARSSRTGSTSPFGTSLCRHRSRGRLQIRSARGQSRQQRAYRHRGAEPDSALARRRACRCGRGAWGEG